MGVCTVRTSLAGSVIWVLAVVCGLAGIWVSRELALQHYQIPTDGGRALENVCTAFATSSCEEVIQSRWGWFPPRPVQQAGARATEPPPGVPTAELGLYYFLGMTVWFVLIGPVTQDRWWLHLIFTVGAALGVGVSLFLAYQMFFGGDLETWCPLCSVTHGLSLLLFVAALVLWPRGRAEEPRPHGAGAFPVETGRKHAGGGASAAKSESLFSPPPRAPAAAASRSWPHWWMVAVTPVLIIVGARMFHFDMAARAGEIKVEQAMNSVRFMQARFKQYDDHWQHHYTAWMIAPPVYIETEGWPARGPEDARHTVVVYSDFECPACKGFEQAMETRIIPEIASRAGGVRVIFKHWPLCTDCNPHVTHNRHPLACEASLATEAARIVGGDEKFWAMHDLLFEKQAEWKASRDFAALAEELGLDREAFVAAMASDEAMRRIRDAVEEGVGFDRQLTDEQRQLHGDVVKVASTPAVYVNNKRLVNWRSPQTWSQVFRHPPQQVPKPGTPAATRPAGAQPPSP